MKIHVVAFWEPRKAQRHRGPDSGKGQEQQNLRTDSAPASVQEEQSGAQQKKTGVNQRILVKTGFREQIDSLKFQR